MLVILGKSLVANDSASFFNVAARIAEKGEGIAILHIQDACSAVASKDYCDKLLKSKIELYALRADIEAQGLVEKTHPSVKMIDFKQWVSLVMNEHSKIVSWAS